MSLPSTLGILHDLFTYCTAHSSDSLTPRFGLWLNIAYALSVFYTVSNHPIGIRNIVSKRLTNKRTP